MCQLSYLGYFTLFQLRYFHMYVFFLKSPERDGSNKLGHTITIMTVDMYINNFVNMYYIFTLFN